MVYLSFASSYFSPIYSILPQIAIVHRRHFQYFGKLGFFNNMAYFKGTIIEYLNLTYEYKEK